MLDPDAGRQGYDSAQDFFAQPDYARESLNVGTFGPKTLGVCGAASQAIFSNLTGHRSLLVDNETKAIPEAIGEVKVTLSLFVSSF